MASEKEIRDRIKSISDTMKITRAMYMISSIKMQKARRNLKNSEPYFYALQKEIGKILYHFPHIDSMYFTDSPRRNADAPLAVIVMTGDKGMCGSFNMDVLKTAEKYVKDLPNYRFYVVGEVGRQYLTAKGYPVADFYYTSASPNMHRSRLIMEEMIQAYVSGQISGITMIYTRMVNTMRMDTEIHPMIPIDPDRFIPSDVDDDERKEQGRANPNLGQAEEEPRGQEYYSENALYLPNPHRVLHQVIYNYICGFVYGALVESSASEENSRMKAMQAATDNAQDMLADLSVSFNRVRQGAITQEITEVAAGARAYRSEHK
ncbi:MAG: ATP synthase F1 subunit gamma [Lachnospiraceae bacterium]|nr:ATP synthase F1 subunit gamma [Lachnospiraceae bacterium]